MRIASLAVLLCAFWLVSSGYLEPILLGFMAASCVVCVLLARRLGTLDREGHPIHVFARAPAYWAWLFVEVVTANLAVVRLILSPRLPISPRVVEVPATQADDLGRATHANSITLTPGTVTLDVRADRLVVHALTEAGAKALATGAMDEKASWLAGGRA